MPRIAFVTAIASAALDDDMPLLLAACARAGLPAEVRAWDDFTVSWARYDAVVLRSPWDYHLQRDAFLYWCERVARASRLLNPVELVRWNTDKHYLADLEAAGLPVVPTRFVDPEGDSDADAEPLAVLEGFLAAYPDAGEIVVKPAVSAGSRDTARYRRDQILAAANHLGLLLAAGRAAMLQPYLDAVDMHGETALLYFDGAFSHAIRKAALLRPDAPGLDHTALPDAIAPRAPDADELRIGEAVLAAVRARGVETPLYARIDLIHGPDAAPRLLELELTEPSLFFATDPRAADRFVAALIARLRG
jgi:O-ureido-D-serine cyclo-ligase